MEHKDLFLCLNIVFNFSIRSQITFLHICSFQYQKNKHFLLQELCILHYFLILSIQHNTHWDHKDYKGRKQNLKRYRYFQCRNRLSCLAKKHKEPSMLIAVLHKNNFGKTHLNKVSLLQRMSKHHPELRFKPLKILSKSS